MTELEWLKCPLVEPMLEFVIARASDRVLRLFAVACCRESGDWIRDPRSQRAVDLAELYADGQAGTGELEAARAMADEAVRDAKRAEWSAEAEANFCMTPAYRAACDVLAAADAARAVVSIKVAEPDGGREMYHFANDGQTQFGRVSQAAWELAPRRSPDTLRDIFGNPFRPVALDEAWRTATVTSLAEAIYAERAFERLPILADPLEEAGCTSAAVLEHCRGPGPHVRGCWVVDLVLGKE